MAKKSIFDSSLPNGGGGGSVFFVTQDSHRYLQVRIYIIHICIIRRLDENCVKLVSLFMFTEY